MTCRCATSAEHSARAEAQQAESYRYEIDRIKAQTPDATKYQIIDVARVGQHLVLKVLYPNCSKCSYEGNKILVFLNVTEKDVIFWKEIDPHFRPPGKTSARHQAPSPAARFPASPNGWADAMEYAKSRSASCVKPS